LVGCLPSMPSAGGRPPLFEHFDGNTQPSDSPSACTLDSWLMAFSNRRATSSAVGADGVSRFSRVEFPCMPGASDCAESYECFDSAPAGMAFRLTERRRHSGRDYFAAQYPACMYPCQRFDGRLTAGHA
jgi:hypothetical protein